MVKFQNKATEEPAQSTRKRRYTKVTDEQREELVCKIINDKRTCIDVAAEIGLDYENAKLIYRVYKREGRVKQTLKQIKRYAGVLKNNPGELRGKLAPATFDKITKTWASLWENSDRESSSQASSNVITLSSLPSSS